MSGTRFSYVLKRVDGASAVSRVEGAAERFFNKHYVIGSVPTDAHVEREDTIQAAEIIRQKIGFYLRGRDVFVITDGRKFGGVQTYPFLVSVFGDDGMAKLFLLDFFSYPSATGAAIAADMERPIRELAMIGANTRSLTTDNCSNLVAALKRLVENLKREAQSKSGSGVIHTRCANHTACLALDDAISECPAAREWQTALMEYGGFLSRRKVSADLRAVGVTGKIPRYMDGKWVANLDLSDFISIWEDAIERVRSSQRGTVPAPWNPAFREINEATKCFRLFINATQRDQATIATVYRQKTILLEGLKGLAENAFAVLLATKLDHRFASTADGVRCEAAFILSPEGHWQYSGYVASWGNRDPLLTDAYRAESARFARHYRCIRDKVMDDAVLLFPGVYREAIGAAFDAYLRQPGPWLKGEAGLFGWKRVQGEADSEQDAFFASLAVIYAEMPAGEAAAERLFSTFAWIWNQCRMSANDDLVRAEMIIKHALIHH
jgi:hypothetical protein